MTKLVYSSLLILALFLIVGMINVFAVNYNSLVPSMTDYTSPSPYVASASSEYNSGYAAWKAFDGVYGSGSTTNGFVTQSGTISGWLKIDLSTGQTVKKYSVIFRDYFDTSESPRDWTFEGSNDDINWSVLDTQTGETFTQAQEKEYIINNTNSYRYYRLNITNNNGNSNYTTIGEIRLYEDTASIPDIPTNLTATENGSQVDLSWDSVTGVDTYNVYRSDATGAPYETTVATGETGTTYSDTTVTAGNTYYYVVTAVNTSGESGTSNEASVTIKCDAPVLSGTAGNMQTYLSWTSINDATGYNVKRGTISGNWTIIANGITETTYTDTTVTNGTTYYYVVTAVNTGGESAESNEVILTPTAPTSNKALLTITMENGTQHEYDLALSEVDTFITWFDNRVSGTGKGYYEFTKTNVGPFTSRTDYIVFEKIQEFEVSEYTE